MRQPQKTKLEPFDLSVQVTSEVFTQEKDTDKVSEDTQTPSLEKRKKEAKKALYLNRV